MYDIINCTKIAKKVFLCAFSLYLYWELIENGVKIEILSYWSMSFSLITRCVVYKKKSVRSWGLLAGFLLVFRGICNPSFSYTRISPRNESSVYRILSWLLKCNQASLINQCLSLVLSVFLLEWTFKTIILHFPTSNRKLPHSLSHNFWVQNLL